MEPVHRIGIPVMSVLTWAADVRIRGQEARESIVTVMKFSNAYRVHRCMRLADFDMECKGVLVRLSAVKCCDVLQCNLCCNQSKCCQWVLAKSNLSRQGTCFLESLLLMAYTWHNPHIEKSFLDKVCQKQWMIVNVLTKGGRRWSAAN